MQAGSARRLPIRRGRDRRGGTVSLLVILMVPVCILAAVVAAAVPRRLAAQAVMDDAATQLAAMTVVWQQLQARPHDSLGWYFPDCAAPPSAEASLDTSAPGPPADSSASDPRQEAVDEDTAALGRVCAAATDSVLAGLSARGVDTDRLSGYHTSAYSTIPAADGDGGHRPSVPCRIGERIVLTEAVHVGITAAWGSADWAAGQVWPHGIDLGSHDIAALTRPATDSAEAAGMPSCTPLHGPASSAHALAAADATPTRTAFGNPAGP
ncbi:hypothetical protein [Candidatus Poriferisodalis sp.]|uniref:hypothetical protein n=1 Tax=Candidatus Poriferisodalis sp. TaxID=3101277 RepID=UPI003B02D956